MSNRQRREWFARLWATLGRGRRDAELERELRLHLELAAEDERRRDHLPEADRRAATMGMGSVAQSMDAMRDQRGLPWLDDLAHDVRHSLRGLRRNPMFAAVALLTLAIGIGANAAVFSVVNGVLLRPLSYPNPEELVAVWHSAPGAPGLASVSGGLRLSPSMFFTYAEQNRSFSNIGLWTTGSAAVTGLAEPEQVRTILVTDGTLQALGVGPRLGRWLSLADQAPGAPQTVMLAYGYWQRRFGGDQGVIGRGIIIDSRPREIVGVMPEGFRIVNADADVILPLAFDRRALSLPPFGYLGVARLKPGVTTAAAAADIARLLPIWMTSWPMPPGVNPRIYESWRLAPALRPLKQDVVGNIGSLLWVLMGTIGVVMLIACANVANLLLVRAEARQQELAVRAALGAGWGRIVRSLLLESVLLGLIGGAFGLGLAYPALRMMVALGPANLPRLSEISIDSRALGFTLGVSLLSGLSFGLLPAFRYAAPRIAEGLHGSGRASSQSKARNRARNILVVAQVALALVLLVCSGLMIRTFQALRTVEPGFSGAPQLQIVRIAIPAPVVPQPERVARMQQEIVDRLASIAGVESVAFTSVMPMEGFPADWDAVRAETRADRGLDIPPLRVFKHVSPGLFLTAGTRVIAGRDFAWTNLYGRRALVIVSENLAHELWGSPAAALGKRVQTLNGSAWREVIGVVQDVRENGLNEPAPSIVYWPATGESPYQAGRMSVTRTVAFVVRSDRAGTEGFLSEVRQAVWSVNASLPLASVQTMDEVYDRSLARTSFTLIMLAIAGAMALVLGVVGIYGVISYAVSQRTREIGIRLALGAQPRALKRMFVGHGLMLAGVGVMVGIPAAAALTRLMSSLLFGIGPLDPATYLAVPILLVAATALASYLPARRAAGVDPVNALKSE